MFLESIMDKDCFPQGETSVTSNCQWSCDHKPGGRNTNRGGKIFKEFKQEIHMIFLEFSGYKPSYSVEIKHK